MSFLYPAFLLGALAIAIPIVLHLIRRDVAPEVPFTAVRLLRRAPIRRSRRRRLRDLLLLAARVAALLLLALAFARPYVPWASTGTRVVAIDRSYSLGAPGRFARALDLARAAIDGAPSGERVAVIAFDERAEVLAEPGTRGEARAAIERLSAGFGATSYAPMVHKALEIGRGGPGTLIVISDLQRGGWDDAQPMTLLPGWRVESHDTGEPGGNLGVTSVAVEADRVVVSLRSAWSRPRVGRLRVLHDGREIASTAYQIDASASADIPVDVRPPSAGGLAVAVDDPQGFSADDVRYRALGWGAQPRVLIVSSSSTSGFYLARALETFAEEEAGFAVDRATGPSLSTLSQAKLAGTSMIFLTSTRGLDRTARDLVAAFTRAGGGLLIAAAGDLEIAVLSSVFGWRPALSAIDLRDADVTFSATDLRHPIFQPFGPMLANLGQVRFGRVWRVNGEGWQVAARFSEGTPALLERSEGEGRVLLFASDLDRRWNDFPLHPAFVPFVVETARYAGGERLRLRDFTVATAPAGAGPAPGVYQLDGGSRTVSVNVDPREGDPSRLKPDEFAGMFRTSELPGSAAGSLQAQQAEAGQSYWRFGLMLMLAALVAESVVGRVRKV